jgi:2Fe-2S ferredoxin
MCSTCHIYILSNHTLPEKTQQEEEVLDFAFFVKPNSRLGCQIRLTDDLDDLVIQIAPEND